jgi:hypothetical protein
MLPASALLSAKATRNNHLRRLVYGQCDADWLAIADYFATVHDNGFCKKLEGLMHAVASCGFVC